MIALVIVLFANGFAALDSIVPNVPNGSVLDLEFSAIETLRVSYSYEVEMEERPHNSILFSGGSFLYSDSFFDSQMLGLGVYVEVRRYKAVGYSGFFLSGITGASLKWTNSNDRIDAISVGMKLGWKYNLKATGVQIELEPSFNLGLEVDNDGYLGLGLGLAIH